MYLFGLKLPRSIVFTRCDRSKITNGDNVRDTARVVASAHFGHSLAFRKMEIEKVFEERDQALFLLMAARQNR